MDLEQIRSTFRQDRFATEAAGIEIEAVGENWARCSFVIEPKHRNAAGAVMGGAIFTLADFAFAVASNAGTMSTVSLASQITFLSAARGVRLIAEARCVKAGRTTCFYAIEIRDDLDNLVASVTTNGFVKAQ